MKTITLIIFFISTTDVFAQTGAAKSKAPGYIIHLTTMNDNMLKGLLLEVKDTSVIIYPGKFKEWKAQVKYRSVEFGYPNIRELALKRKNRTWKKYSINGSGVLFNEFKKLTK